MRKPLLGLVLGLCLLGCTPKFDKPNLSVASIQMLGGNLLQQNFLVTFDIQNPNDRALPVSGLNAALSVGGQQLATGVSNQAFVVPARGDTQFDMTITANMAVGLLNLLNKRQHDDSIDYQLTGVVNIDLPFLRSLPFHQNGSFPLHGR
jgi:LEA14-like dessication related protein